MSSSIKRIEIRENGLVGTLFLPPSERPLPAVLTLGGSSGGMKEEIAELLAKEGFAALALAYFGVEGLPPQLAQIPLEYVERGIDWLKGQRGVDRERVALLGISRGAELALLLGSIFPGKMQAIIAYVPSSAVYGAGGSAELPAWTLRGKPICPNAPLDLRSLDEKMGHSEATAIALTPFFLEGMKRTAEFERASIPVEKIRCPLLLISGQDDQMWPSAVFGEKAVKRLQAYDSEVVYTHISYPGAGHSILPPPLCEKTKRAHLHPIQRVWFQLGGTEKDNRFAGRDSWIKILAFLRSHL